MSARELTDQRVLFIGSPFFGYFRHIIASFEQRGFAVDYFDDRPSDNAIVKGTLKLRPSAVQGLVRKHLERILSQAMQAEYDLIFVLNGKTLTPEFVRRLRDLQPRARAVLYLWDAIILYPHVLDLAPLFDRRYTFDRQDALEHPGFELLPLFYADEYKSVGTERAAEHTFDLLSVCTAHANRYATLKEMLPNLREHNFRVFSYLYQNPLRLVHGKIFDDSFKTARLRDFHVRPLSTSAYLRLLRQSRAVLDINHAAQSGLTARTIETIGARKKLVTTNGDVKEYAFYDPTRIHVVDPMHLDLRLLREFLDAPMSPLDENMHESLGIDHWVTTIIDPEATDE